MLNMHEQLQLGLKAVELNTHNIEDLKNNNVKFLDNDNEVLYKYENTHVGEEFLNFENMIKSMNETLNNGVRGILAYYDSVDIFIEDLVEYDTRTPGIKKLKYSRGDLIKYMGDNKKLFTKLSNRKTPVISGLSVNYMHICNMLDNSKDNVESILTNINDLNVYVSNIITSKSNDVIFLNTLEINNTTNKTDKELSIITDNKTVSDRVKLNKVVKNLDELLAVSDRALVLGNEYKMEKLITINDANALLINKLKVLFNITKIDDNKLTKEESKELVKLIDVVAKKLTAVAFLFYIYQQLINMIIGSIKLVEAVNEDTKNIDGVFYLIKAMNKDVIKMLDSVF